MGTDDVDGVPMSAGGQDAPSGVAAIEGVWQHQALHIGPAQGSSVELCGQAVRGRHGLHLLAHYSRGVYDFSADVLDAAPDVDSAERLRAQCRNVGRQLSFRVASIDQALQEAHTGSLIRVVLQAETGALYCNTVLPMEHLIGVALERPDESAAAPVNRPSIQTADRSMAELASQLRASLNHPSQNPGGFETAGPDDAAAQLPEDWPPPRIGPDREPAVRQWCVDALTPRDLHYVAYCRDNRVLFAADYFDHPALVRFFGQITPAARRSVYEERGRQAAQLFAQLGRSTYPVFGGDLVRLVLDVEFGAIYFYHVGPGEYAIGVTLDQDRVSQADAAMARLAVRCRERRLSD